MGSPLKFLKKGSAPSMLDTETANALISAINELRGMIVSPAGFGKLVVGEKEVKLDLGPLAAIITNLQKGGDTINNTTINNSGDGGTTNITIINQKINQIINALNNASISSECNEDGSITTTLVIPGLPSPS